jgi:competence protein ComFC
MQDFLLDLLFPQEKCCLCHQPGNYNRRRPWCSQCVARMHELSNASPICMKCGKYIEEGETLCGDCQQRPPAFEIARAVGPYEEGFRIATKVLKFLGRKSLAVPMGHMMTKVVKEEPAFWPIDVIVPVPISRGSKRQRGFNQSELLARQLSKELKIPMRPHAMYRIKETPAQKELTREEREKNLLCAFEIRNSRLVYGKKVLLVDDVYTTGSTGRECTRVLLGAGAEKVNIITWATGRGF